MGGRSRLGSVRPCDRVTEVVDSQAQPLLELDARLPAELLLGPGVVEGDPVHIAFAWWAEGRLEPVLGEDRELAEKGVGRHRDAGADVEGASVASLERGEVGRRDVADMEHVARLVAVAVDGQRLAFEHPAGEDGDHASLFREEVLACAIDVRAAKGREGPIACWLAGAEVLLERELGRSVWRERPGRMVFLSPDHVRLAAG